MDICITPWHVCTLDGFVWAIETNFCPSRWTVAAVIACTEPLPHNRRQWQLVRDLLTSGI